MTKIMHQNSLNISLLLLLCGCLQECLSEAAPHHHRRPSTTFPYYHRDDNEHLPYNTIRGGSTLTKTKKRPQHRNKKPPQQLLHNAVLITVQIHRDTTAQLQHIQSHASREFESFLSNLPKLQYFQPKSSCQLDEVINTFSSVLHSSNNQIDTSQLLKACRSHLHLMKSAGSSLRLVAKDLESNVSKVERVYKSSPKNCRTLSSLLEFERSKGIHDGNRLKDPSAAMGLLWIRRSLAFQCDLYSSLTLRGMHPREAAMLAYTKHLKPYHGWALGKLFTASLTQLPVRKAFIAKFAGVDMDELNEPLDSEIVKKLRLLVGVWDPLLNCWKEDFERLNMEDVRRV